MCKLGESERPSVLLHLAAITTSLDAMASSTRRRIRAQMEVFDPAHTLELATRQGYYTDNVFLFVPNLIGARHILSSLASRATELANLKDTRV